MTTVVVAGSTFTWGIGLFSQADVRLLQANPTMAAGGGGFGLVVAAIIAILKATGVM